jgi:phosphatidylserine decarboxylase
MTIHKAGIRFLILLFLFLGALNFVVGWFLADFPLLFKIFFTLSVIFFLLVLSFFRRPIRKIHCNSNSIYAPADGTVVVIEETMVSEFLNEKRLQISIFMSPLNVHINWYPLSGLITYFKYHPGKHYCAWLPKASTDNEMATVVIKNEKGIEVMVRQIAGALARRIVSYAAPDKEVKQNSELGFIKLGSRVDVFLPLGTKINVEIDQKVRGSQTVLAELI